MSALLTKRAQELREMWQSRVLRESDGIFRGVLLAIFAEIYPTALKTLLMATYDGFEDLELPLLRGYAKIAPSGRVVCMMIDTDKIIKPFPVFETEGEFLFIARSLADKLKLSDKDRVEYFDVLRKWIVADMRVGPHGQRLAS